MPQTVDELLQHLERLRIEEDQVLRQLLAARARETADAATSESNATSTREFCVGDRVRIANAVRSPLGRPVNEGDRVGTVTKVTCKRVFLVTGNGGTTSHAPTNLPITNREQ